MSETLKNRCLSGAWALLAFAAIGCSDQQGATAPDLTPRRNDCLNFGTGQCSNLSTSQANTLIDESMRLVFNYPAGSVCHTLGNAMYYHVDAGNIDYRSQPLVYYEQGQRYTTYGEWSASQYPASMTGGYVTSSNIWISDSNQYSLLEVARHEVAHSLMQADGIMNYTDNSSDAGNGWTAASISSQCR